MAKSSFERALEKYQRETNRKMKQQMQEEKRLVNKQQREADRRARLDARRERAASIVSGQPTIGSLRILDKTAEELVSILCAGYKREDYRITNQDVIIPEYIERDIQLEFEKLKQYGLISQYNCYLSGIWEIGILPSMLSYEKDKEETMSQEHKVSNYTNVFNGNVSDIQIQQGTSNSTQTKVVNNSFDYEAVSKFVEQIKKYDSMLDSEFGKGAEEIRAKVDEISCLIQKQENPSRIKNLLGDIKNLVIGVGGSIIATGILGWLQHIGIPF